MIFFCFGINVLCTLKEGARSSLHLTSDIFGFDPCHLTRSHVERDVLELQDMICKLCIKNKVKKKKNRREKNSRVRET